MASEEVFEVADPGKGSFFNFPATLIANDGVANDTHYDQLGDLLTGRKATLVVNVATY